ncbi:MAG: glycosyltransferase, partial [Verrucomicrobiae bacterium]|nr:glycosyltransferase [Verrucomicrobiae bacterium]
VGDGPYLPELRRKLPKGAAVFTGFLSGEALLKAYASADVFVFPSTTDTFGNVVLEAQASGLPAIVSDKGGPCEQIIHGRSGFITQGRDAEDLCRAMRQMMAEPELRSRMSGEARTLMRARSWEKAFETFWPS